MPTCKLCQTPFKVVSTTHLQSKHGIEIKEYTSRFGFEGVGFTLNVGTLPHDDERYIQWRQSLLKRPAPWSKGYTKETHPSVAKISRTFRKKKIDNFAKWREKAREQGIIPKDYPDFQQSEKLAFLIGMMLGDGTITKYQRTEGLRIALGTDKPKLWKYTAKVVAEVFQKQPHVYKSKTSECMLINLYQKEISKRLEIPSGDRGKAVIVFPDWIMDDTTMLIQFLRGLYEAEGSFNVHKPTYTYKLIFSNRNDSLLNIVYEAVQSLGFHPHRSKDKIQISRKEEVYKFKDLISFRQYA